MRYLLLLFIVMPVLEMWLLISVGSQIGALPTMVVAGTQNAGFQPGSGQQTSGHNGAADGEVFEGEAWERKDLD